MVIKRILSFLIDLFCMAIVYALLRFVVCSDNTFFESLLLTLPFALLFCRDSFTGRSIGRKLLNISIVDEKCERPISPLKALIRNMLLLIWPIEFIILLVNKKRLGDSLVNSKVVEGKITHKVNGKSIAVFVVTWLILFLIFYWMLSDPLINVLYS